MKKILIFSHAMELGGAERSLVGLLETIDTTQYAVDLFLMRHSGELMSAIPKNIKLLSEIPQYASLAVPIVSVIKRGQLRVAFGRLRGKLKARRTVRKLKLPQDNDVSLEYSHKFTLRAMPKINDKVYDLAISFLTPHYFAAEKIQAKKKIAWIHTDYSMVAIDRASQLEMWSRYDVIASISEQVSKSFLSVFPELKAKVQIIANVLPPEYIRRLEDQFGTEAEMPDDGTIKLLSIGRFCAAKNFDNIPDICKRLKEKGINAKWYLIGYGGDEPLIRRRIEEAEMQDSVIILGKKKNPYPYIKACDIYVQPSRYEGNCVSVREAQMLGKPVVITNYATSASQLEDGVDGIIVPMDNAGCAAGIAALLRNPAKRKSLSETCLQRDYSNSMEVQKLYELIES